MKIKFLFSMIIAFLLVGNTIIPTFAAETKEIVILLNIGKSTMLVDDVEKKIDADGKVAPVLVNNTTLVPISAIIQALGGEVKWVAKEQKVTVAYNGKTVDLWLNKSEALVNGKKVNSTIAPKSINGRTMVPLKFVSENLGLCVNWEGSTKAISISVDSDYVAYVGSEKVNEPEYNIVLNSAKSDIMGSLSQNASADISQNNIWETEINGVKAGELAKQMALEYLRQQKILLSKAKANKVTLTKEKLAEIDDFIAQMIQQEGGKALAEIKMMEYNKATISEYTAFLKDYELVNMYLQEEVKKIEIADAEVLKIYENNKASFDTVTVKHIFLSTISDQGIALPSDKQAEVKKKAEEILSKVQAGGDFDLLAKEYSEDPGSKENGGEYTFVRGKMVKEFEDWSFKANMGDTGIIKSDYGYHVMKFVGKSTFEDVKDSIRNSLANEAMNAYVKNLLSDTKFVVIKNQKVYEAIEVK